ncbi:MAG: flagellin [Oscillospiraceae bacterium]|nr:flagellin [Oscillospiraceae bacterium]
MLSTNATATGLASRIKGNADKIDGYLASLGSALNRLNGDDGASSDATSARYNLTEAQTSLTTAEADLRTAKQDVASAGNGGTPLYFQVGANANQGITVSIDAVTSLELGIGDGNGSSTIDVLADSGTEITNQLDILDEALSYVTTQRSRLGAVQNRMEYTQSSLEISAENLTNAESRIRDVDMAKEMTNFTKMNILYQASTAMLAQANALPQGVLQMLG